MNPSFFSLFKRGRYVSIPHDGDDSDAAQTLREERERFAVAALAFCLKHDEAFRRHFWEKICRVPGDPEQMPPITKKDISIEPPEWADLSLVSDDGVHRYMWVVEAKAGAKLQEKQNPAEADFKKDGLGYGALFAASEAKRGTKMRYIVLGHKEPLEIRDDILVPRAGSVGVRDRIAVQERRWADLLDGLQCEGIIQDWVETLGGLRIGEFYMKKAETIVVTGGLTGVGKAWTVFENICEWLGLHGSEWDAQGNDSEDGVAFGVYIKQADKRANTSEEHKGLIRTTGGEGWCVAWFGYADKGQGVPTKSVWLYCKNEQWRNDLLTKVKRKVNGVVFHAEPVVDGDSFCIAIKSSPEESGADFNWFVTLFRKLLALGPPGKVLAHGARAEG